MSLYEIMSMTSALERLNKKDEGEAMSDDEFDALKDAVASMNLPGMRLH